MMQYNIISYSITLIKRYDIISPFLRFLRIEDLMKREDLPIAFRLNVVSANLKASSREWVTTKLSKNIPALVVQTSTAIPAIGARLEAGDRSDKRPYSNMNREK